jgi:FeS assembly protein IscX
MVASKILRRPERNPSSRNQIEVVFAVDCGERRGGMTMARELNWTDTEEIGIQLQEMFPDTDPYSVRFTDLHKWVVQLPGFVGDPAKSTEGILEAIQTAWHEEYEDAKG